MLPRSMSEGTVPALPAVYDCIVVKVLAASKYTACPYGMYWIVVQLEAAVHLHGMLDVLSHK